MPTYREGYIDGFKAAMEQGADMFIPGHPQSTKGVIKKRKLSAWNKYVKANSKKPRFKYRSGKLNLKKMAIAFRKTPAGKKKRKR